VIKAQRLAAGLTQQELAKQARTVQATVARIENGSTRVSLDLAMRVLLSVAPKGVEMKVGGKRKKVTVRAA